MGVVDTFGLYLQDYKGKPAPARLHPQDYTSVTRPERLKSYGFYIHIT